MNLPGFRLHPLSRARDEANGLFRYLAIGGSYFGSKAKMLLMSILWTIIETRGSKSCACIILLIRVNLFARNVWSHFDLTVTAAAQALGVTRKALELINGHSGVSPEMAICLSKAFGGTTWLACRWNTISGMLSRRASHFKVKKLYSGDCKAA